MQSEISSKHIFPVLSFPSSFVTLHTLNVSFDLEIFVSSAVAGMYDS